MNILIILFMLNYMLHIQVFAQPDIPKELEDILHEIVQIKNESDRVKNDISMLLEDARNLTIVYSALNRLYNTNMNICFNYSVKSMSEKNGANITGAVNEFLINMNKFSDKFATKIIKIVQCARDKYHLNDLSFQTFNQTIECIEQFFKPIPGNLRQLLNHTKELTQFLRNITTRIQFDCFVKLLNTNDPLNETPNQSVMAERVTAQCLTNLGEMLQTECVGYGNNIMKNVRIIKDHYQMVIDTYMVCEQDKMKDIRNRLINDKNFDINLCNVYL